MKQEFLNITITVNGVVRNAAFAKGINRSVNLGNVKKILELMKMKGYRNAEVIQVIKAEEAIETNDITLVDINGNELDKSEVEKYYLVLDGQHRTLAVSLYNEWARSNGKEDIEIPAIMVELKNETVVEYINDINITKKEWGVADYVRSAANISPENKFLERYKELIKDERNTKGYPISTLNLIFCGNKKALSKRDFSLLCSGMTEKGKKVKRPIIPAHNLGIGDRFIQICKDKGFDDDAIAKRYLITQFNDIKTTTGSADEACRIFQSITPNDKAVMFNANGNLDEGLVMEQFAIIKDRYTSQHKNGTVDTEVTDMGTVNTEETVQSSEEQAESSLMVVC